MPHANPVQNTALSLWEEKVRASEQMLENAAKVRQRRIMRLGPVAKVLDRIEQTPAPCAKVIKPVLRVVTAPLLLPTRLAIGAHESAKVRHRRVLSDFAKVRAMMTPARPATPPCFKNGVHPLSAESPL